ncbi:MAG: AMP-binding protein, partial [Lachnospiraceae bacterium]|nr:AMP-binding protein [Lachnospiraceae bacterium]
MSVEVRKQTAVDRFLDVAEKYPDSPAVEDRHGRFSFRQVEEISNLVAEELVRNLRELRSDAESQPQDAKAVCDAERHPPRDGRTAGRMEQADFSPCAHHNVGVIFPRQKEVLPAFLGILRSANCYVFSAPDAPVGRLNYILQDADISCVITTREASKSLKIEKPVRLIFMEDVLARYAAGERAGRLYQDAKMEDPAYVTYTSGSTGNPKGVVDTYYYIDNHVGAWHHYYVPKPGECVGSIVSYSYAASTYDLFSGLTVGANLYIFHEEEMMDQVLLDHVVIEKNITSMFMIPSMIPVVFAPGVKLPIRWIITAGEKAKQIPELTAQMAEIYGSSEAAAVLGRITHPGDPWDLLGKPFAGTTLYLLDENGNRITEPGKVGELCIVNNALSAGYLNLPEETFAKFKPCPFLEGRRMYVSGDMMRFDKDGNYYFCGRKDNMTKINGQRVEMGEIESAIVKHPAVEDAVCAVAVRNKTDILVCYYVAKADVAAPGPEELERHTSEKLPRHMVPRYFVQLSEFPKNINGKVDRKSLPEPDFEDWTANVPPEAFAERKLLEIARRILPDIRFGVTDDLMKLGMDSIKAVQFVAEAAEYDPRLTVSDVMRHRSIRAALGAPKQAAWLFAEYDESKPVIVLLHGIIPVSGFSLLCGMWEPFFNIYVIGPFPDYIMQMVGRYDYNDLISFYMRLLDEQIPDRANVWGFVGFSFGGQMAISMAAAFKEKFGRYTHVIMGDTLMQTFRPGKVFPVVTEDDPQMQKILQLARQYGDSAVNEPTEALIKKQNAVVDLLNTIRENTKYDGPVLYLDAKPDYDERMEMFKISVARGLYRKMELAEFPNSHHNELYLNRDMEPFYRDYFVRTGALDMCRGTVQAQIRARKGMFTGTAIECGGRTVSYSEFDSTIERIGCHLANAGIGPGCFVAVRMRRSEKMVMAVFGVLWSGAAVVPVNDDIPSKRFRFMMDACKVRIVLDDALYDEIMAEAPAYSERGEDFVSDGGCKWARPEDPAMALFTSGSMGSPKGICHSQASIRRLFVQFPYDAAAVGIRPAAFENVIGHTQPGYVITYNYEYPSALLNGKKLVLLTDTERISAADISAVLERNPKSMLAMVPSQLAVYMENESFCKAMRHISCLQTWAEPVSDALKGRIGECLVKGSTAINLYGQTETTGIAWQNIFDAKEGAVASLDVDIRILKEDGSRANAGEKGEICVHSPMQFMGYPGENRIPPNTVTHDGNVYVKTGDMGCLTDEGRLMLLGRGDRMIKFHGQRIELPEIEKAMMDYPGIEAAAVVVCKNAVGVSILAGFYVSLGDRTVSLDNWLAFMRPILPEFMIPSAFIRLEKMPVGATGKIDFYNLELRVISASEEADAQDLTEEEKLIITLAAKMLHISESD